MCKSCVNVGLLTRCGLAVSSSILCALQEKDSQKIFSISIFFFFFATTRLFVAVFPATLTEFGFVYSQH